MIPSGTEVTWKSQANGFTKTKTGTVLAYVPARQSAAKACPELRDAPRGRRKSDMDISQLDRYVVAVTRPAGVVDYYTPNAAKVVATRAQAKTPTIPREIGLAVAALDYRDPESGVGIEVLYYDGYHPVASDAVLRPDAGLNKRLQDGLEAKGINQDGYGCPTRRAAYAAAAEALGLEPWTGETP